MTGYEKLEMLSKSCQTHPLTNEKFVIALIDFANGKHNTVSTFPLITCVSTLSRFSGQVPTVRVYAVLRQFHSLSQPLAVSIGFQYCFLCVLRTISWSDSTLNSFLLDLCQIIILNCIKAILINNFSVQIHSTDPFNMGCNIYLCQILNFPLNHFLCIPFFDLYFVI